VLVGLIGFLVGWFICVSSGFRREVADNCALLGCYTASSGNLLPTFRDNLSGPSSGSQESERFIWFGLGLFGLG